MSFDTTKPFNRKNVQALHDECASHPSELRHTLMRWLEDGPGKPKAVAAAPEPEPEAPTEEPAEAPVAGGP